MRRGTGLLRPTILSYSLRGIILWGGGARANLGPRRYCETMGRVVEWGLA